MVRRTPIAAAVISLAVLAACDTSGEPSAPPTAQDALTTATSSPPEDEVVTSEPVTEEPTTEEPEAEGPPEMPAEAMEQTEAGAEAFVGHYLALLNYTGEQPRSGLLEGLGTEECGTCGQFEAAVVDLEENDQTYDGPLAAVVALAGVHMGETAVVTATVDQLGVSVVDADGTSERSFDSASGVQMEFQLVWADQGWRNNKILLVEQGR